MAESLILSHDCNGVHSSKVGRDLHRAKVKEMIHILEAICIYTDLCITQSIHIKPVHLGIPLYVHCFVPKILLKSV